MSALIRLATLGDATEIATIYAYFVLQTPVTFEAEPPDVEETASRISKVLEMHPWLVCESEGRVAGYAYASQHRNRYHYQWAVDFSVYVHEDYRRKGVATALYNTLLEIVPLHGYVTAYAGIALPNAGSVGLHESFGFQPVGVYRNVGHKFGQWHDVGWWQRTLVEPPKYPKDPLPLTAVINLEAWKRGIEFGTSLLTF
jgi:phosphinothricin acetyltransferase